MTGGRAERRMARFGALLGVIALGACGSGHAATTPPTSTQPAPAAIGLREGNLPAGWTQTGTRASPDAVQNNQLFGCLGLPAPLLVSQTASPQFSDAALSAYSVTTVLPTTTAATAYLAAVSPPGFTRCAAVQVPQVFNSMPPGTSFGSPTVAVGTMPKIAEGSASFRLTMPISTNGTASTATADLIFVQDRTAVVEVVFVGTSSPLSSATEGSITQSIVSA